MIAFLTKRMRCSHIQLRLIHDEIFSLCLLLAGFLAAFQADFRAGEGFAALLLPLCLAFFVLNLFCEAISSSRYLLYAVQLLYTAGLCVQLVLSAVRSEASQPVGAGSAAIHCLLSIAAIFCGVLTARYCTFVPPLRLYLGSVLAVAGLGLLLLAAGQEINGTKAWISVWGMSSFQLTELIRLAGCLGAAAILSSMSTPAFKAFHLALLLGLNFLWALLLNEWATPLTLLLSCLLCTLLGQRDIRPALAGILLALIGAVLFVQLCRAAALDEAGAVPILQPLGRIYRTKLQPRLDLLFHFEECDPQSAAYQMTLARTALCMVSPFGASAAALSVQVPVQTSDFVFTALLAVLGLVPALMLLFFSQFLILEAGLFQGAACAGIAPQLSCMAAVTLLVQTVLAAASGSGYFLTLGLGIPFLSHGGTAMVCSGLMAGWIGYAASGWIPTDSEGGSGHDA